MDVFETQEHQAEILAEESVIYLHCCDSSTNFSVTIPSLPFLRLHCFFCHFSFLNSLSERRICIIPQSESLLEKLVGVNSPCIVKVKASTSLKFYHGGEIGEEEDERQVLLVWDLDVDSILSTNTRAVAPVLPETVPGDNNGIAPLLDLNTVNCNCSNFPTTDKVVLPFEYSDVEDDIQEENIGGQLLDDVPVRDIQPDHEDDIDSEHWFSDEEEERGLLEGLADLNMDAGDAGLNRGGVANDDEDEELTHTVAFKCIGAAHEKRYQDHLEQAHIVHRGDENAVKVALRPEPSNPKDANAIAIDMDYGTGWKPVGYIATELCQYLHPLIVAGGIVDVSIQHIVFRVDFRVMGFYPKVMITRHGIWEPPVIRSSFNVR